MSEANKTVVRRIAEEVWNERKHDRIDEFFATDFVNTDPSCPEVKTLEHFKQWLTEIHNGFSEHHVIIEDMVAEGDKVAKQWLVQATHTGDYMGIPATNKKTNMNGITIYRIVDGKVKECVWSYDTYGFLVQVGVIPSE